MTEYIYIVKCPGCEDEMFDFFTDARMQCDLMMSKHPIITQVEVERNDFGECIDSHDLGTVWSWEEAMKDTEDGDYKSITSVFTKDDLKDYCSDSDPEFDNIDNSLDFEIDEVSENSTGEDLEEWINTSLQGTYVIKVKNNADGYNYEGNGGRSLVRIDSDKLSIFNSYDAAVKASMGYRNPKSVEIKLLADEQKLSECRKSIPEGMTIESLVEEMEENEDTVECKSCEELFDKAACDYIEGHGWLCTECKDVLSTSSKLLPFKESTDNTEKAAELDDTTLLYYKDLTVTVSGDEISGGYYDPPEWEDIEYTDEYEYEVDTDEIAGVIYDKYLTDEDVPGGISTLDDDDVWEKFWIDNLEKLVEKYNSQLLDYYREDAEEDAYETFQERYDNEREAARDEYYERQAEDRYWRERERELEL